jgi:preprotein translocase SecE subunit
MAINQYFKDTMSEMKHVSWPTRKQAMLYTILVIAISIVVAAYVGVLDTFLIKLLNIFINS